MDMRLIAICLVTVASGCGAGDPPISRPAQSGQSPADTTAPAIPSTLNLPEHEPLLVASTTNPAVLYYRNVVLLAFADTTRGATIRAVLNRFHATVIGGAHYVGTRGAYVTLIPDPGRTMSALDSVLQRLEREPGVEEASSITYKDVIKQRIPGRP
jgi:hypothetical protein